MSKYTYQMDLLLQNIFRRSEKNICKCDPANWIKKMTNVVGGTEHQHAHSDQGRPHQFKDEDIFPFVATHGFGKFAFQLWLLPNAGADIKYGFLKTFKPTSLVLMRGDFVHAGGISKEPRCHMEFYPKPEAGKVHNHTHHYWLEDMRSAADNRKYATSFLWQGSHFPFAYPFVTYKPNAKGQIRTVISYPPEVTSTILAGPQSYVQKDLMEQLASQRF